MWHILTHFIGIIKVVKIIDDCFLNTTKRFFCFFALKFIVICLFSLPTFTTLSQSKRNSAKVTQIKLFILTNLCNLASNKLLAFYLIKPFLMQIYCYNTCKISDYKLLMLLAFIC